MLLLAEHKRLVCGYHVSFEGNFDGAREEDLRVELDSDPMPEEESTPILWGSSGELQKSLRAASFDFLGIAWLGV
jgi:hypothetical protein